MKGIINIIAVLALFAVLVSPAFADTSDLEWRNFEINDQELEVGEDGERIAIEEGATLEIEVGLEALDDVEDVQVTAEISGYEYADYEPLMATSHLFDLTEDTFKTVSLDIELPVQLDKDEYYLRIRVTDKNSDTMEQIVRLYIEPSRHGVEITDVFFSPGDEVQSGRSLLTTVVLQNYGDNDEEDVKISVSIPELGVSATDYIEILETNANQESVSYETSEEMFLSIPDCAAEGVYSVDVIVTYDYYETVRESYSLTVVDGGYCTANDESLVVAVGPESQNVAAGQSVVYTIAMSNDGSTSETYSFEVSAGDWASVSMSDSLVVLAPGQSQVVESTVTVSSDAVVGSHAVNLYLMNDGNVLETFTLNAVVAEGADDFSLANALEIALVVLVVLFILVLLVVAYFRLQKDDDEEQTYY